MIHSLIFEVIFESSRCAIASMFCFHTEQRPGTRSLILIMISLRGGLETNHQNFKKSIMLGYPVIELWGAYHYGYRCATTNTWNNSYKLCAFLSDKGIPEKELPLILDIFARTMARAGRSVLYRTFIFRTKTFGVNWHICMNVEDVPWNIIVQMLEHWRYFLHVSPCIVTLYDTIVQI